MVARYLAISYVALATTLATTPVEALVQKLIDEDKGRQNAILDLALQFENSCTTKDDLRNAYEKFNDISQESRALIDTFLKEVEEHDTCDEYVTEGFLTEKELQQLAQNEEAYKEYLEEEAKAEKERARAKKEWEEFMKEEQAHDELFRLECGVKSDSEYETD
ncbi:hypothetical protein Tco_0453530 [Tanacetum coccineum]